MQWFRYMCNGLLSALSSPWYKMDIHYAPPLIQDQLTLACILILLLMSQKAKLISDQLSC